MAWAVALGPCSGEPSRVPKGLGLAESSALSRPPPGPRPPCASVVGDRVWTDSGPRAAALPLWILLAIKI